jgi:Tfp pilus assembly protein PilN
MLKPYFRINEVCGVNMIIALDGSLLINACIIKTSGNQLEIEKKIIGLTSLKQLKTALPSKVIISLNMVGKGILIKQIDDSVRIDADNFSKILPNANSDEFYVQQFISGGKSFVSLIRRTEAEKWLQEFINLDLEVLSLSLGPFTVQHVLPQLNFYAERIIFDGHEIHRNEQADWVSYRYAVENRSTFPIKLETEKIDEKLLLPYATAFQLILIDDLPGTNANVPQLQTKLKAALSEKKITVITLLVLGALFALLLGNFVLFTHYNSINEQLALRAGETARNVTDVNKLNTDIKHSEDLLDSLGWDGGINKAIYIDRIAQLLPPEVTWKDVVVNPVDGSMQKGSKSPHFLNRKIKVTGYSQKIMLVNEWMGRLKSLSWVKNVELQNYTFSNEENTGQFTAIINY